MKATVELKYFNLFVIKVEGRESEMPQDNHDIIDSIVDAFNSIYVVPDEDDGEVSRYDLELVEELRTTFACDHFQTYYMVRLDVRSVGYKPNYICHKAIPSTDAQRFNGVVGRAADGHTTFSQDFKDAETAIVAFFKALEIVESFQASGSMYDMTGKSLQRHNIVEDEEDVKGPTKEPADYASVCLYNEDIVGIKSLSLVISNLTRMTVKERVVWE